MFFLLVFIYGKEFQANACRGYAFESNHKGRFWAQRNNPSEARKCSAIYLERHCYLASLRVEEHTASTTTTGYNLR